MIFVKLKTLIFYHFIFSLYLFYITAVRNDRNKKKTKRQEDCIQSEELTEDEQLMLQEILEAHRDTFQKQDEKTPSRVPEIKTNGLASERLSSENPDPTEEVCILLRNIYTTVVRVLKHSIV